MPLLILENQEARRDKSHLQGRVSSSLCIPEWLRIITITRAPPRRQAAPQIRRLPARGNGYMLSLLVGVITSGVKASISSITNRTQVGICYLGGPKKRSPVMERRAGVRQEGIRSPALRRFRSARSLHSPVSEGPTWISELDRRGEAFRRGDDQGTSPYWSMGRAVTGGSSQVTLCVTRFYHPSGEWEDAIRSWTKPSRSLLEQTTEEAVYTRILRRAPQRAGSYDLLRPQGRVSPFSLTPSHAKVICCQVWREMFPIYRTVLWVATQRILLRKTDVTSLGDVAYEALVNIILAFGRNNDRNVQRFVNGRFGDRIWTYLCIKMNVSNHTRYFVGPNDIHIRSKSRPKIVILHLQSLYKVPKKFFYDVFGPNRLLEIQKYVHNRSLKHPFTKRCTFRSLLRPKARIMFTREVSIQNFGLHRRCTGLSIRARPVTQETLRGRYKNNQEDHVTLWTSHPPREWMYGRGAQVIDHLGMTINSVGMSFRVPEKKIARVVTMAKRILKNVRANRRRVDVTALRSFAGTCQSLSLAVPETRFRLRDVHCAIALSKGRRVTLKGAVSVLHIW